MLSGKPKIFLLHTEKTGLAKVACEPLINLAAGRSTTIFLKRLDVLLKLTESWKKEDENNDVKNNMQTHSVGKTVKQSQQHSTGKLKRKSNSSDHPSDNDMSDSGDALPSCSNVSQTRYGAGGAGMYRRMKQQKEKNVFCCERCGKILSTLGSLAVHMEQHFGATSRSCAQCGKTFASCSSLQRHQALIHRKEFKKLQCGVCGKLMLRIDYLRRHMLSHTGEFPYLCATCGKPVANLSQHQRSCRPSNSLPFQCLICMRAFDSAENLKSHVEQHSESV